MPSGTRLGGRVVARVRIPDGTPTRLLEAPRQVPRFVLLPLTVVAADTALASRLAGALFQVSPRLAQ